MIREASERQLARGVDPQRRAGEAEVAERALAERVAHGARVRRPQRKPQPPSHVAILRLQARHLVQGVGREYSPFRVSCQQAS